MTDLPIFLINLDASPERLATATAELSRAGLPFTRLPAVDARGQAPESFAGYDDARARRFYGRPMTGGEVGCYLSHLAGAEAVLASGADMGLVLEDDFTFAAEHPAESLTALADALWGGAAPGWEIVNVGRAAHKYYTPVQPVAGHMLMRAHYFPVTTTGVLWSRAGAEAFLATRGEIYAPLDHFFRRFFTQRGTGLALTPPLVLPSGDASTIDADGSPAKARKRLSRTPLYFWREFRRQSVTYASALAHQRRYRAGSTE
ncbi:glycosyltransferase family 25 protein [Pseudoroseicyclus sp. H15]